MCGLSTVWGRSYAVDVMQPSQIIQRLLTKRDLLQRGDARHTGLKTALVISAKKQVVTMAWVGLNLERPDELAAISPELITEKIVQEDPAIVSFKPCRLLPAP